MLKSHYIMRHKLKVILWSHMLINFCEVSSLELHVKFPGVSVEDRRNSTSRSAISINTSRAPVHIKRLKPGYDRENETTCLPKGSRIVVVTVCISTGSYYCQKELEASVLGPASCKVLACFPQTPDRNIG